jgi:hypothetical protein
VTTKNAAKAESFRRVGAARWEFGRVTSERLTFVATTTCIGCGAAMTVRYGTVAAVFRVGQEFVGVSCDACLTPEARERLAQRRDGARR